MALSRASRGTLALLAVVALCSLSSVAQNSRPDQLAQLGAKVKQLAQQGKYADALPLATEALKLAESPRQQDLSLLNIALLNLADVDEALGHYSEAEPLYLRALSIDEKELGPDDPDVANDLDSLGWLYYREHRYADAEPLFERALTIDEKAKEPDPSEFSLILSNAATLFQEGGKYARAESLYQRAVAIDRKTHGDESTDVASDLNNFADLFDAEGKFAQAETLFKAALAIDEKALNPDDPSLATDLNNLADHYRLVGDFAQAETLCLRALHIREKAFGPDNPDVAGTLNILALLYQEQQRYTEAEPLFERSLAIREKIYGVDNPGVATAINNLAELDVELGRYNKAEPLLKRSLGTLERNVGPGNPDLESAVLNLASLYADQGRVTDAEPLFQRGFNSLFDRFQSNFTFMTEKERLGFLDLVSWDFRRYFEFVYKFHAQDPSLSGSMYNLLLWQKGCVAGSVADMRRKVEASGDAQALHLLAELTAKRTQLAALLNVQPAEQESEAWRSHVEKMRMDADQTEKALITRSSAFAERKTLDRTTWQQVRDALQPGEAAIEFARFRFHNKAKTPVVYYAALVVTHETKDEPQYIFLGDDKQIESDAIAHFKHSLATRGFAQSAQAAVPGPHAYELVWKPLEAALTGITRVDLATDGVLNQVPLGIIPAPDGKLLMEKYDLRLVSSTRDLLRPAVPIGNRTALLIGNPTFDLSEDRQRAALQTLKLGNNSGAPSERNEVESKNLRLGTLSAEKVGDQTPSNGGSALPPLPGTGAEVQAIADLMHQHGWQASVYTGDQALKRVVEQAGSSRLIHLATHGFFLPDPVVSGEMVGDVLSIVAPNQYSALNDPMLRSGLYFAAADRTLAGKPSPPDLDNGVLTALEAGNLNLSGTQLVVLSACETGQGDEKNGEGVFGLRRALQEAGAQSVLMSLWSVPDKETLELMQSFYTKWLSGVEIHQALKEAQLEIREQVKASHDGKDLPYYWGAFVLVGR